ncbi:hypothetical protein Hanom_Chr07g00670621 [Helianthus anomalus]
MVPILDSSWLMAKIFTFFGYNSIHRLYDVGTYGGTQISRHDHPTYGLYRQPYHRHFDSNRPEDYPTH